MKRLNDHPFIYCAFLLIAAAYWLIGNYQSRMGSEKGDSWEARVETVLTPNTLSGSSVYLGGLV